MNDLALDKADLLDRAGNLRVNIHDIVRHDDPIPVMTIGTSPSLELGRVDRNRRGGASDCASGAALMRDARIAPTAQVRRQGSRTIIRHIIGLV